MTEDGSLSPAGKLIEAAREARRPKLSQRKAADAAGISDSRWRQLVAGHQLIRGQRVDDPGPADTLARMALAVGVTADELRGAGRPDAADVLAGMKRVERDAPEPLDRLIAIRAELDGVISQLRTSASP